MSRQKETAPARKPAGTAAAKHRPRAEPQHCHGDLNHLQQSVGNRAVAGALNKKQPPVVQRYDTPEHVEFGDAASQVTVAGVTMTQGEMITMGDFFSDVAQMEANPRQVRDVLAAVRSGSASTAQWQAATGGRYVDLALNNEAHFAAPNPRLVAPGGGGTADHQQRFASGHNDALWESAMGRNEAALAHNGFACHFLTDAFSAGHMVNKADVMHRFNTRLGDREDFLDAVAARAWQDENVRTRMSRREMVDFPNLDFDSEFMFQRFLRGVDATRPDVVVNSIALVVHDALNGLANDPTIGGLEVHNDRGDTWRLSGDESLHRSPESLRIGREAVAQSYANIAEVVDVGSPAMTSQYDDELLARVWAFVPRPTAVGEAQVVDIVDRLTDPGHADLIDALGQELADNIAMIIDEAQAAGRIRVIPIGIVEEFQQGWARVNDPWFWMSR